MNTIDYIYRFDPTNPTSKTLPSDPEAARRALEDGNRTFSRWMDSCHKSSPTGGEPRYVVSCNAQQAGVIRGSNEMPKQSPFGVVVGCSDARVPTEMLFGHGFNDLFVVRVAGNVLGDVCRGSIDYALHALRDSVRVVVILGHSGCGAVSAAVDAYLLPEKFWSKGLSPMVRGLIQRILVSVREAANGMKEVWGVEARKLPGHREALIESAVAINAAQVAFDLTHGMEGGGNGEIRVLYGVYNIRSHQVSMPVDPAAAFSDKNVRLALAPTNPKDFHTLAVKMAEILAPKGVREAGGSAPAAMLAKSEECVR